MQILRRTTSVALLCLILTSPSAPAGKPAAAADWPQWRGPTRDGRVEQEWPDRLQDTVEESWSVKLEPSYSGPIVVGDRVFVTETKQKKLEVVRALDRKTGETVWTQQWEGSLSVPFFAKANGDWIRSTPAFDDGKLFVAGIRDVLLCLNAADGAIDWQVDFVKELKTTPPAFGFVCSPLVDGEAVFVQAGGGFVRLDKRTGKIVWRVLDDGGGMNGSAFSSPVLATLAGRRQLVVQTRTKLCGVDPTSGDVLWSQSVPAFRGMNILTPTIFGDTIFTSTYGGKSFLYEITAADGKFEVKEKGANKLQGYMSSPVVIGRDAYFHLRNQRAACVDLETGAERWVSKPYGQYWSLVTNGEKILALDERGDLLLMKADPEKFNLIDTFHVSDTSSWAHLAVCGDEIFVRELESLKVFRWKK